NILRISTLANITRQQDEEARAKETKVRAEDLMTRVMRINYGKAKELVGPLTKLLSPRGDITVDDRTNAIIVKDIEKGIDEVSDMVEELDTRTPQVMIEARIVQIRPEFKRELGIQWGAATSGKNNRNEFRISNAIPGDSPSTVGDPSGFAISPALPVPDFAVNLPTTLNLGGVGFTFGKLTGNPFSLDLRLSAGESRGSTRIISTPKVAVLDNQEAKIEQGESIPFQTTSQQGTQTTFIDANLSLKVTPHISPDGGVVMDIKVSKNAPGSTRDGASGPSILKKEATTHILVMDGETAVIGGIFEKNETETTEGIPYLMDIPLLGWLFKREIMDENTSELLVFLTPTVME
ncbi:MAG: type IV pilus secretin PilQ, partial [Nitrospiria bacterium]